MEKLADKAQEFAVAMTEPNAKFDDVAKRFEVTPARLPSSPPGPAEGTRRLARSSPRQHSSSPRSSPTPTR